LLADLFASAPIARDVAQARKYDLPLIGSTTSRIGPRATDYYHAPRPGETRAQGGHGVILHDRLLADAKVFDSLTEQGIVFGQVSACQAEHAQLNLLGRGLRLSEGFPNGMSDLAQCCVKATDLMVTPATTAKAQHVAIFGPYQTKGLRSPSVHTYRAVHPTPENFTAREQLRLIFLHPWKN
jgi:hypothetical protein